MSDLVIVYQAHDSDWRWKRVDTGNHETLSESSEGFREKSYAEGQAKELNPGVEIEVWD